MEHANVGAEVKAKSDALRLLAFKPRSVAEMRDRLKRKKYPDNVVSDVIESLKKHGFLNDEQFARLYANSRMHTRPQGKRQLEFDLSRKGLPKELVARTMAGLDTPDEKETARQLVSVRFQKMTGLSDQKKKTRLFGFLKRRGFSSGTIFSVMKELFKEIPPEDV